MMRMPILRWRDCFLGGTGYIDGIVPSDMNAAVMLGCKGTGDTPSPFVALRTASTDGRRAVTVLFQRYRGVMGTWASSDYGRIVCEAGHFLVGGIHRHELLAQNIANLLHGKSSVMRFARFAGRDVTTVYRRLD